MKTQKSLEEYRAEFSRRRGLAMPLAGTIAWSIVGIGSLWLNAFQSSMLLFAAVGGIVYLAMLLAKFTGENLMAGFGNPFDRLFFAGLFQAWLTLAIVIPFFMTDYRALTLGMGIMTSLMWITFSWIVQSPIGYLHCAVRIALILIVWYRFPEHHFQTVPAVVVVTYLVTIAALESRWRKQTQAMAMA
jgi:hypothetical protein